MLSLRQFINSIIWCEILLMVTDDQLVDYKTPSCIDWEA